MTEPENIFIVKPIASSQGKGIYLTNKIQEIATGTNTIVQRYIHNPMLINGYKFDLRFYVLLTNVNPLRIYIFEEGLVRFATEQYFIGQPFNDKNRFVHLTNYSVNKESKKFVQNKDPLEDNVGSKWSLSALKKYFLNNVLLIN